jgi:hypothetical protein
MTFTQAQMNTEGAVISKACSPYSCARRKQWGDVLGCVLSCEQEECPFYAAIEVDEKMKS